jgi:hypothetical protein
MGAEEKRLSFFTVKGGAAAAGNAAWQRNIASSERKYSGRRRGAAAARNAAWQRKA